MADEIPQVTRGIVTGVRTYIVAAEALLVLRVYGKDAAERMGRFPVIPAVVRDRIGPQTLPGKKPFDSRARHLQPFAAGIPVVHEQVGIVEIAGHAEGQSSLPQLGDEGSGAAAEWSVGDEQRPTAYKVVHDLVVLEDADGVGARIVWGVHCDDAIVGAHEGGIANGDKIW